MNDIDPVLSTSTDESTSIQNLPSQSNEDFSNNESNSTASLTSAPELGKVQPYWIPDNLTNNCMQCDNKFTVLRRRHHCRACGLLLCSNCCSEKHFLIYLGNEGRICGPCNQTLIELSKNQQQQQHQQPTGSRTSVNPANPMEYCSVVPPQQQVGPNPIPPTVMVPTGVLKRGPRSTERKSVIFSDGVRPGDANLTDLDEPNSRTPTTPPEPKQKFNLPKLNDKNNSFIPDADNELPPVLLKDNDYRFVDNNLALVQRLRQEQLRFAVNANFYVICKIVTRKETISISLFFYE
jgi:MAD (mothers against decapentaplegic) interacting protein